MLAGVTRTIRGYVTGNLLISLIAGIVAYVTLVAVGVPFALPLAVVVAILDLVPLVGRDHRHGRRGRGALAQGVVPALIVVAVLVVYQQIENHLLQPVIYGRTVQLSPLMVLISILIAGSIAGILGALIAIPIAGSLQVSCWSSSRPGGSGPWLAGGPRALARSASASASGAGAARPEAACARTG